MTTATMNGSSARAAEDRPSGEAGRAAPVTSLDELAGAHPDSLRALYAAGRATDPAELGDAPRGLFLAFQPARELNALVRPLLKALADGALPWKGKVFEADGTGKNVVWGGRVVPFAYEKGPSSIDGAEALVLRYDRPEHRNPWPVRNVRDELRTIADGIAIGPALFAPTAGGEQKVLLWFGLTRAR
jgi:hypothetical protein